MTNTDNYQLCIVGAGLAGAGIAHELRDASVDVTILEKSRGVGGRAATRRKHDCRYDHGANYIKDADGRTTELLRELGQEGLVDIPKPVWTFDSDGNITPGDRHESHKWTWTKGITQFAKRVLDRTDATVHNTTRVDTLARLDGEWTLTDTDGDEHGPFDAVALTPPAPQTAELLANTTLPDESTVDREAAIEAVRSVPFRTIRTVVLRYPFALEQPFYALVNTDRDHEVGWLARESCKSGHVPDGELLIVQMAPDWSTDHYDEPVEAVTDEVVTLVADLLDDDRLKTPDWVDDQGWRYALPDAGVDTELTEPLGEQGLYLAGDWINGNGRAHEAFWSGVDAGKAIRER